MARHAASPPRRATSAGGSVVPAAEEDAGGRSLLAGGLVAGGGVLLVGLTVGALLLAGVGLAPRGEAEAAPAPSATPTVARVALTSTPAQVAVTAVLTTRPEASWTPTGTLTWTAASPFDEECGRPGDVDAALAAARAFTIGRDQVLVSVWAYSAGQGATALAGWSTNLGSCSTSGRVGRVRVDGPGGAGLVAWLRPGDGRPDASLLLWRRGDVLAAVAVPTADPQGLAQRAAVVDAALLRALAGRCADTSATRAGSARSPWVARDAFTGLTEPLTIAVDPSPTPTGEPGAAPVAPAWKPSPLPSVSMPERPADPVWPADLPTPVASPVAPHAAGAGAGQHERARPASTTRSGPAAAGRSPAR